MTLHIDSASNTDQGNRDQQEDFHYPGKLNERPWLGIVADGMGGHQGGKEASNTGVLEILKVFTKNAGKFVNVSERLTNAVTAGHHAVLRAAERCQQQGNMGSTVVAFVIDGTNLHWCSAGDSRLYLYRAGQLEQLSKDFTLENDLRVAVSRREMSEAELQNHPQKHALTSFMGTDNWRVDADSRPLMNGDVIIACTDGVYGTIDDSGLAESCQLHEGAIPSVAQKILGTIFQKVSAEKKKNQDNYTAIVVRVSAPSFDASSVPVLQSVIKEPYIKSEQKKYALFSSAIALIIVIFGILAYLFGVKLLDSGILPFPAKSSSPQPPQSTPRASSTAIRPTTTPLPVPVPDTRSDVKAQEELNVAANLLEGAKNQQNLKNADLARDLSERHLKFRDSTISDDAKRINCEARVEGALIRIGLASEGTDKEKVVLLAAAKDNIIKIPAQECPRVKEVLQEVNSAQTPIQSEKKVEKKRLKIQEKTKKTVSEVPIKDAASQAEMADVVNEIERKNDGAEKRKPGPR